jgi:hypothetical protein
LKNRLWEVVNYYFDTPMSMQLALEIWTDYLVRPKDDYMKTTARTGVVVDVSGPIRDWYRQACWHEVYDFLDYLAGFLRTVESRHGDPLEYFTQRCNEALEKERSGYRMVSGVIVPVTDAQQVHAVNGALAVTADRFASVHEHLKTALARLGDLPEPDCRNSMKESICAVETLAKLVTEMPSATLAEAMKCFKKKGIPLHPALNDAWQKIYGYTSAVAGVRHGLYEGTTVGVAEARYLLVTCSAFVFYLIDVAGRTPGTEGGEPTV